ncbi:GtrA family protein [Halovenus rubra]|uniref:GtrA family protein n=2 Tax=Halovenus rubra TaxID=869890 RepID=A0ACC7E516_9EURY|nr:GtrA family protein [Halovenus rubra]
MSSNTMETLNALRSRARLGKFVSVGVVGSVSDNSVLAVLGLLFGFPEMLAKVAGIQTSILVMFLVNEHWTFAEQGKQGVVPFAKRLGKSHLVRAGGVSVQLVVYWVLTQRLTFELQVFGADLWFIAASPVATAFAMTVNYVFESLFTWQVHADN